MSISETADMVVKAPQKPVPRNARDVSLNRDE